MDASPLRDIRKLSRIDLLDDYLKIAESRGEALVATALRTKSVAMRDIVVHGAVKSELTSKELKDRLLAGRLDSSEVLDVQKLGELGRLVLLQNLLEDDPLYGEALLTLAHQLDVEGQLPLAARRVLIQHHVVRGNTKIVEQLLDRSPDVDDESYGYLRAETLNPFSTPGGGDYSKWLQNFNQLFRVHGLTPVAFSSKHTHPFDNIHTESEARSTGDVTTDPLVSVVLTTYQPDEIELMTSVESILNQTWANLELIVVDDCSGPNYRALFAKIEELDSRVKVLHATENRGTYVARNIGYARAQGEFITGQDDDDWSHPERLVRQVECMQRDREVVACRTMAIACDYTMNRCRPGYKPVVLNASSLMLRRSVYEQTGAYLESRKAADTEFYLRLQATTGGRVADLAEPLAVIRIRPDSLSRADFSAGWRHPTRTSFRSAYRFWHRHTSPAGLSLGPGSHPPVRIPRRYQVSRSTSDDNHLDIVFAGDWQRYGGPQKSMLEELSALLEAGYRVGVMNLEAARFMNSGAPKPLNDEIQELINDGIVDEVFYDEEVYIRLLILRYPPILQFFTHESSRLHVGAMVILANQAPSELDGSDVRYLVEDCHENAKAAFGVNPLWVPQGPQVRDYLEHYLQPPLLADFDMPGILNLDRWWHERLWYRSTVPVVGRHSRDDVMKWPDQKEDIEKLYRIDGEYDVRVMGGYQTPLRVLGAKQPPAAWTAYKKDAMPVPEFLYALDYFVFYQHPQAIEAFGRAILEALASGVVVILPKHFERVFGPAALYSDVNEVRELIRYLHSDFSIYQAHLAQSRTVLEENFSYSSYKHQIENLLG